MNTNVNEGRDRSTGVRWEPRTTVELTGLTDPDRSTGFAPSPLDCRCLDCDTAHLFYPTNQIRAVAFSLHRLLLPRGRRPSGRGRLPARLVLKHAHVTQPKLHHTCNPDRRPIFCHLSSSNQLDRRERDGTGGGPQSRRRTYRFESWKWPAPFQFRNVHADIKWKHMLCGGKQKTRATRTLWPTGHLLLALHSARDTVL